MVDISVLFEDEHILVVNKPSSVLVHDDGESKEETLVDFLLQRAPEARGVGEVGYSPRGQKLERSGVVHRIDRDTSGVVVLAKNEKMFKELKCAFHERLVKKEYRTFVYGSMKEGEGTITRSIGRSRKDFRLRSAERGARGTLRESCTRWQLLDQSSDYAYLAVFPHTGRTHQIRVHMKSIGRSIVKDPLYAPRQSLQKDSLGFTRLALHAYSLSFVLRGSAVTFTAPLPFDFLNASVRIAKESTL